MLSLAMCRDQRRVLRRDKTRNLDLVPGPKPGIDLNSTLDAKFNQRLILGPDARPDRENDLIFTQNNSESKQLFDSKPRYNPVMPPPNHFTRGVRRNMRILYPFSRTPVTSLHPSETYNTSVSATESESELHAWQNAYVACTLCECKEMPTHRDHPLLPRHGQDGIVASWSPGSGVDEKMNSLIGDGSRWQLSEHDVQIHRSKNLLQGVESQPTQFTFNEIGPVLHDSLQLQVPIPTLPPRYEVEHVGALHSLPSLPAGVAGKSDAQCGEDWEICSLVSHSEEPGEEIDLARHGRDG